MTINNLREIIQINNNFKTSVNLHLSLNKTEKILSYIPTKSTVALMYDYLQTILENREQATLLIGPYGKGKSHLLLVLLAVLSLERNTENTAIIDEVAKKIADCNEKGTETAELLMKVWQEKGRFMPIIINNTKGDLNQDFLIALRNAIKRDHLNNLIPETYYSVAVDNIKMWQKEYPDTYTAFEKELSCNGVSANQFVASLTSFSSESLDLFKEIYPRVTAGGVFSPLASSDVFSLYKSVSEKLTEEHGYSGIFIVFDEFSKFIESQDGTAAGQNMKLIQDICELATESSNSQVFVSMVAHKSIKEYGNYLSREIINSFTGIEGRLVEKYFITSSKGNYELIKHAIKKDEKNILKLPTYESLLGQTAIDKYYQLPIFRSNFEKNDFARTVVKGCFPLTPVSTYLLLQVSEKVAQNERTLFTFISNNEPNSMARYVSEHSANQSWIIEADSIYDYFSGIFKKDILNEMIHNIWLSAEYALSKCTSDEEKKLIKTLAVVLITNKEDELPADDKYLRLAADFIDYDATIQNLVQLNLVYKKKSTNSYVFKTKASATLRAEIRKQRELKGDNINYSKALNDIVQKYFVTPRRYNAENTITRYFKHEYLNIDAFMSINDQTAFFEDSDRSDGKVITLYSFKEFDKCKLRSHFEEIACEKLIIVVPNNPINIRESLRDYEILSDLKYGQFLTENNEIFKRELPQIEDDITTVVEGVIDAAYSNKECRVLRFGGGKIEEYENNEIELAVNEACGLLFPKAIHINNEIINRTVISTAQTRKARNNIINAILNKTDDEEFYSGTNQEATIYRAIICNTGILTNSAEDSFREVLKVINGFIDSCCDKKRCMSDLINQLINAPYGIRAGIIPVIWAFVLSKRNEDIVIYQNDIEILLNEESVTDMCENHKKYSLFVSKEDLMKEKYIKSLQDLFKVYENRNLSDNRISNVLICMQRWFRGLPQVSRNLAMIEDIVELPDECKKMKLVKKLLQKIDVNPYEALFIKMPTIFGVDSFDGLSEEIKKCYFHFENYINEIQGKAVETVYSIFCPEKTDDLYHALTSWYKEQSDTSKQGLYSSRITTVMSFVGSLNTFDDISISCGLAKATNDIYVDNWVETSCEDFHNALSAFKQEVESLRDCDNTGQNALIFVGKNGKKIERYYNPVGEETGSILRNILEDTIDEFDDLDVNDRVAILLEMVEKVIG